jgi:signal transduction histidine kinase
MDRLFLRFHLKLLLALVTAGFLAGVVFMPLVNRQVNNNFEDFLTGPMKMVAEALREERTRAQGTSQLLARTAAHFRSPVAILPKQELSVLPEALRLRLDRGEVVGRREHGPLAVLYVAIPGTDEVLRVGPLRPKNPLGQGRGIGVLAVLFLGLSLGIYLLVQPLRKNLAALAQAAEAFRGGQLTARADVRSRDAIGALAASFNRMAHEIQRLIAAQRELLQMVSHELRTPLQRIHLTAAIARETEDDEQRERVLARMERDVQDLDELIDELLSYIRLEREIPIQLQDTELTRLIEALVGVQREQTDRVSLSLAESSADLRAQVDPRLLRRALSNLIGNALRHAKSRVEISAGQRGGTICLDVDDDGPGIAPADRERIFDPFQRLEPGSTNGQRGYGLGLAIVRRIAERHGGTVAAGSSPLGGARFRLSLPG